MRGTDDREAEHWPAFVALTGGTEDEDTAALIAYVVGDGGVVIMPTDTVYGLVACASDRDAVEVIYQIKQRPREMRLPLLVADASDLARLAVAPSDTARVLAQAFWPGALTIVVRAARSIPVSLADERGSVALRCPDHAVMREVIRRVGEPLVATSVNFTGMPEAASLDDMPEEILESVDLVVDGGDLPGVASTIVDCIEVPPRILRQGAVELDL